MTIQATPLPSCIFNPDHTMTLHGHWALQQAVLGYCRSKGYLLRQFKNGMASSVTPDALNHWRQGFAQALADFANARVFIHVLGGEENSADENVRLCLYLSEGEARAYQARVDAPLRDFLSLRIRNAEWPVDAAVRWREAPVQCTTVAGLCRTDAGIDELIHRLDKQIVAPYSAADWQALQQQFGDSLGVVWTDMNQSWRYMGLARGRWLLGDGGRHGALSAIVLPSAWGTTPLDSFSGFGGDLQVDPLGWLCVFDAQGQHYMAEPDDAVTLTGHTLPMAVRVYFNSAAPTPHALQKAESEGCLLGPYAYVNTRRADQAWYEASHGPLQKDAHGDVVCDIITAMGHKLNGPDAVALAGTLERGGCVVKRRADLGPRRVGWLVLGAADVPANGKAGGNAKANSQARLGQPQPWQRALWARPQLIWADLHSAYERKRPVQDPVTQLWGWADEHGKPAIKAQFARAGHFHRGLARAWGTTNDALVGLVNHAGQWVLQPQWRSINWSSPQWVMVQNARDEWGVFVLPVQAKSTQAEGADLPWPQRAQSWLQGMRQPVQPQQPPMAVALQPAQVWLEAWAEKNQADAQSGRWVPDKSDMSREDRLIEALERVAHDSAFNAVQQAKQQPSLASLAGVFDDASTTRDLMQAGVWLMRVKVLHDKTDGIRAQTGEHGHIFAQYPVGLDCFDLSQEAPVQGLQSRPDAVVGLPWASLCWMP